MKLERLAARALERVARFCRAAGDEESQKAVELLLGFPLPQEEQSLLGLPPVSPEQAEGPYGVLTGRMGLGDMAMMALEYALALFLYPELGLVIQKHCPCQTPLTLEHVFILSQLPLDPERDYVGLREVYDQLEPMLLPSEHDEPFFRRPLRVDERLFGFFCGEAFLPEPLKGLCERFEPEKDGAALHPFFAQKELPGRLLGLLESLVDAEELGKPLESVYIQLTGGPGGGKKFLLKTVASQLGFNVLFVDAARLLELDDSSLRERLRLVRREADFYDAAFCFHGLKSGEDEGAPKTFLRRCLEPLGEPGAPIFLCTDPGYAVAPYTDCYTVKLEIPPCTRADRIALWRGFWEYYGLRAPGNFVRYSATYKTSPRDIQKAVRQLALAECDGEPIDDGAVASANYMALPRAVSGKIVRVPQGWSLDDLKLPEDQKQTLRHVCAHVLCRHQVFDEWGLENKYAYGKAVSVLFAGPPGTGKTMAANILASELGLALYRVDLSQVVDKYIGESEKRLEQVFATAEKSNVLLFFDEADSIFGKRSEVKEANDRFANIQVSYILQRIEDYDGVVILATNLKKNIDEAFMRRMRYLVEFQLPGAAQREELWRACLPAAVPQEKVDFAYLARQFELAGGAIKNIALNAAFLAAEENNAVTMRHILDSVRNENLKRGKTMLRQDFAEYGFLYDKRQEADK